ncbi:MAG: glycosyltransferase family 39 protein [bacterium]|nr:glycosyltransferase family 39 protein [bacterium]
MSSKKENFYKYLPHLIALSSLILSLVYSLTIRSPLNVDAKAHQRIAINLAEGNGYWEQIPPNKEFDRAIGRSGPLLEFWIAGVYKVFGVHIYLIWIIQALLHAATVFLIYRITQTLFDKIKSRIPAAGAAIIYGWYPDLIESTSMLMTEISFLFLLVLSVFLFLRYHQKKNISWLIFFSISFGLAYLARSAVSFAYLAFLGYFISQKRWKHLALSLVIVLVVLTPWIIRNYQTFGAFIPSRIYGFYTLYVGNHHGASGENEIEKLTDAKELELEKGVFALDNYAKGQYISFIKKYPGEYLLLHFKRLSIFWSFIRPTGFWPYLDYPTRILTHISSGIFSVITFVLGLTGLVYALSRKRDLKIVVLAGITALTMLPYILSVVETRYRYGVYPLLALFAGFAVYGLLKERTKLWNKIFLGVSLVLITNTILDLYLNWGRFLEKIGS